jgi:hypothetical protein
MRACAPVSPLAARATGRVTFAALLSIDRNSLQLAHAGERCTQA